MLTGGVRGQATGPTPAPRPPGLQGRTAVVIDEWDLASLGMANALESTGVEVVGRAATGHEGLRRAKAASAELVVWGKVGDLPLPQGVRRTKALDTNPRVAALLPRIVPDLVLELLGLGAEALLIRSINRDAFVAAVRRIMQGERVVAPALLPVIAASSATTIVGNDVLPLTPREREVLQFLADGRTNREIADLLFISLDTVKSHLSRLYGKLEVTNRHDAVARALSLHVLG